MPTHHLVLPGSSLIPRINWAGSVKTGVATFYAADTMDYELVRRISEDGWSFEKAVPVDGGMLNMKNSVRTTIPDVYKIGQWSVSPAGLPTCILTAKLASDFIVKD